MEYAPPRATNLRGHIPTLAQPTRPWTLCVGKAFRRYRLQASTNVVGLYGAAQAAEYYAQVVKLCAGSDSSRPELAKAKLAVVAQK